ncbi:MAG: hypothetical protein HY515_00750 [Candidatus Aenigmarchaeota archaeon]|nr:hypothetical protein [Candidatus Aenigmarchaeota archaeon]
MLLKIPFYRNDGEGNQCAQVAMQSVLKYFLNKEYSVEELDRLTDRKKGFWTWTTQIASALHELGLDVRFYSKGELEPFLEGESFIRKRFGKDAEKMIKLSNMPEFIKSIKILLRHGIFERKILTFKEIESHIKKGHVPIMLVDYREILKGIKTYQGHFAVVTGFDNDNIFYHASGPRDVKPNKKAPKKTFLKAWNSDSTDNDVIIVLEKRHN